MGAGGRVNWRVGVVGLVCLVVSACTPSGRLPVDGSGQTTGSAASTTVPAAGLSRAFVSYRYPVDGVEWQFGWRSYELPVQVRYYQLIGDCVTDGGYGELGGRIRNAKDIGFPGQGWLFPDLASLREHGFEWESTSPALNVIWTVYDPTQPNASAIAIYVDLFGRHPELGVSADEQTAAALNQVVWSCVRTASGETLERSDDPWGISPSWLATLSEMERTDDQVWFSAADALSCARLIDPVFSSASSLVDWFTILDGTTASMDDLQEAQKDRRRWGRAYGTCVERLVQVRTQKRLTLRDRMVTDQLAQLVEQQATLDAVVADVTGTGR
jgi:hypothetical protein